MEFVIFDAISPARTQSQALLMKKSTRGWYISFMTTIWLCPYGRRDNSGRVFHQNCFNQKNESNAGGCGMGWDELFCRVFWWLSGYDDDDDDVKNCQSILNGLGIPGR